MVDLGEVVVLRGEPEDGGVGLAGGRRLARAGDGGCGFEGREERAAEETNLLAGEDGSGALGECCQQPARRREKDFVRPGGRTSSAQCAGTGRRVLPPISSRR